MVVFGNEKDIDSWMELVKFMSWNFPGLETDDDIQEHKRTILRFMKEKRAICIKDNNKVVGVLLFSMKHSVKNELDSSFSHRNLCRSVTNWIAEPNLIFGPRASAKNASAWRSNMICYLAVLPEYRKRGYASELMTTAIKNLDKTKDITVSTFRDNDEKGIAPRALYKKFGFVEGELIEEFGYPNQKFILKP